MIGNALLKSAQLKAEYDQKLAEFNKNYSVAEQAEFQSWLDLSTKDKAKTREVMLAVKKDNLPKFEKSGRWNKDSRELHRLEHDYKLQELTERAESAEANMAKHQANIAEIQEKKKILSNQFANQVTDSLKDLAIGAKNKPTTTSTVTTGTQKKVISNNY